MPKISALPAAVSVGGTDLFAIVQGSTTKKATASLVLAYTQTNIQITESQVTNLTTDLAAKLAIAANLSDLNNVATARQNLGIGPLTNGQLIIGSTGVAPVLGVLSPGTGIAITNGAGSILISATGSGQTYIEVTGTSQAMATDTGYISSNAGVVTLTLPVTAALGTGLSIVGKGAGGWAIAQNASQVVQIGSVASTAGAGGSVASSNRYDSINLICTTANTVWTAVGAPQSAGLTVV